MRATTLGAIFPVVLFASASAQAHFKLQEPADWLVTNATGDPQGSTGTQKINPCGAGTPSGLITQVRAGSTLHIKLTETVPHGGSSRMTAARGTAVSSSTDARGVRRRRAVDGPSSPQELRLVGMMRTWR